MVKMPTFWLIKNLQKWRQNMKLKKIIFRAQNLWQNVNFTLHCELRRESFSICIFKDDYTLRDGTGNMYGMFLELSQAAAEERKWWWCSYYGARARAKQQLNMARASEINVAFCRKWWQAIFLTGSSSLHNFFFAKTTNWFHYHLKNQIAYLSSTSARSENVLDLSWWR